MQSTQIQDAITTGKYKAFWVWGLDDVALTPIINKAIAAGHQGRVRRLHVGHAGAQNTLAATRTAHDHRAVDRPGGDQPEPR